VVDYTASKTNGNGFVFYEFSKVSFLDALIRALSVYDNKVELEEIIKRVMNEDFSWKRSSQLYYDLYQSVGKTEKKMRTDNGAWTALNEIFGLYWKFILALCSEPPRNKELTQNVNPCPICFEILFQVCMKLVCK
jgi:hypothetical protein